MRAHPRIATRAPVGRVSVGLAVLLGLALMSGACRGGDGGGSPASNVIVFDVLSFSPGSGATGVATVDPVTNQPTPIVISFNQDLDAATTPPALTTSVTIEDAALTALSGTFTPPTGKVLRFSPVALTANTTYKITVNTTVKDKTGSSIPAKKTSTFTTAADPNPTVDRTYPVHDPTGAIAVPNNARFVAIFNKAIDESSLDLATSGTTASILVTVPVGKTYTKTGTTKGTAFDTKKTSAGATILILPGGHTGAASSSFDDGQWTVTLTTKIKAATSATSKLANDKTTTFTTIGSDTDAPTWSKITSGKIEDVTITVPSPSTTKTSMVSSSSAIGADQTVEASPTQIDVILSEEVMAWTVDTSTVKLFINGVPVPGKVQFDPLAPSAKSFSFVPNNPPVDGIAELVMEGLEDLAGNAMAKTSGFFRIVDKTPPTLLGVTSPSKGYATAPINTKIKLRFSEPLDPATVNANTIFLLDKGSKSTGALSAKVDITVQPSAPVNDTWILTPLGELENDTDYEVTITSNVSDTANPRNYFVQETVSFHTADAFSRAPALPNLTVAQGQSGPGGRFGHTSTTYHVFEDVNGKKERVQKVFVAGGFARNPTTGQIQAISTSAIYDVKGNSWTQGPDLLAPRGFHQTVKVTDRSAGDTDVLLISGGMTDLSGPTLPTTEIVFPGNIASNAVAVFPGASLARGRANHTATLVGIYSASFVISHLGGVEISGPGQPIRGVNTSQEISYAFIISAQTGGMPPVATPARPGIVSPEYIMQSLGNGRFASPSLYSVDAVTTGESPVSMLATDFNGDEVADLIAANEGDNASGKWNLSWRRGEGNGSFDKAERQIALGGYKGAVDIVAGDLDPVSLQNDTDFQYSYTTKTGVAKTVTPPDNDLVVVLRDSNAALVLANRNASKTNTSITTPFDTSFIQLNTGVSPIEAAIADLDADGLPEVATANKIATADGSVSVFRNATTTVNTIQFSGQSVSSATLSTASATVTLDGTTTGSTRALAEPVGIFAADVDADATANADLAVAHTDGSTGIVSFFQAPPASANFGSASSWTQTDVTLAMVNPKHLAVADLDGDAGGPGGAALPDLAVLGLSSSTNTTTGVTEWTYQVEVWLNESTTATPVFGGNAVTAAIDNLTPGGAASAATVSSSKAASFSLTTASFGSGTTVPSLANEEIEIVAGDIDADGLNDLVFTAKTAKVLVLMLNRSTPRAGTTPAKVAFDVYQMASGGDTPHAVALSRWLNPPPDDEDSANTPWGKVDNPDNIVDLLWTDKDASELYVARGATGRFNHTTTRLPPVLGKPNAAKILLAGGSNDAMGVPPAAGMGQPSVGGSTLDTTDVYTPAVWNALGTAILKDGFHSIGPLLARTRSNHTAHLLFNKAHGLAFVTLFGGSQWDPATNIWEALETAEASSNVYSQAVVDQWIVQLTKPGQRPAGKAITFAEVASVMSSSAGNTREARFNHASLLYPENASILPDLGEIADAESVLITGGENRGPGSTTTTLKSAWVFRPLVKVAGNPVLDPLKGTFSLVRGFMLEERSLHSINFIGGPAGLYNGRAALILGGLNDTGLDPMNSGNFYNK